MKNQIKLVDEIKSEYSKGMPDGLTEEFLKKLPILFRRISELERAIAPFAIAYHRESQFNKELINVYLSDCKIAAETMDYNNSEVRVEPIYIPAE